MHISRIVKLTCGALMLSATQALAGACPSGLPADLASFDAETLIALERALMVPLADVANASGDVTVTTLDLGPDRVAFCVEFNTMLTCSNGIVVCALGVVLPAAAEPILLLEAAHELTLTAVDAQGWPGIEMMIRRSEGAEIVAFHVCDGQYLAIDYSPCATPTEALKNG